MTLATRDVMLHRDPLPIPVFPILTIITITSGSVIVSYIAARAYVAEGLPSMLLLGSASLVFGTAALIAPLLTGESGSNPSCTVLVVGCGVSSALHLGCAGSRFSRHEERRASKALTALVLLLSVLVVGAVTAGSLGGFTPLFFTPDGGATLLARSVLGLAVVGFAVASLMIGPTSKSSILYWYSWALAATAMGLFGMLLADWRFDAFVFWVGRLGLCAGGIFMVMSVFSAEGEQGGLPDRAAVLAPAVD